MTQIHPSQNYDTQRQRSFFAQRIVPALYNLTNHVCVRSAYNTKGRGLHNYQITLSNRFFCNRACGLRRQWWMGSECQRLNLNGWYCTYCTSPYPRTSISIHNRLSLPHPSVSLSTLSSLQTKRFLLSHLIAAGHFLPTNHLLLSLLLAYLLVLITNQKSSP